MRGGEMGLRSSNCARFVCAAAGLQAGWRQALLPLDRVIRPENIWPIEDPLPLGAIGVIGTLRHSKARDFPSRMAHGGVGGGDGKLIQTLALGGFMAIRDQWETFDYCLREALREDYKPEEVKLFRMPFTPIEKLASNLARWLEEAPPLPAS